MFITTSRYTDVVPTNVTIPLNVTAPTNVTTALDKSHSQRQMSQHCLDKCHSQRQMAQLCLDKCHRANDECRNFASTNVTAIDKCHSSIMITNDKCNNLPTNVSRHAYHLDRLSHSFIGHRILYLVRDP